MFIFSSFLLQRTTEALKFINIFSDLHSGYVCEKDQCVRKTDSEHKSLLTLVTCNMLCSTLPLWPKPKSVLIFNRSAANFNPHLINIRIITPKELKQDIADISDRFLMNLPSSQNNWTAQELSDVILTIKVNNKERKPSFSLSEKYFLDISKTDNRLQITISADQYVGAVYALETLSQLIWLEDSSELVTLRILHDVVIKDYPVFAHRGLMIDTARHFYPIKQLRSVVDGMVASKLNVLHLHLTDSVSFPIELPSYPEMAKYGAYGSDMVYTSQDMIG